MIAAGIIVRCKEKGKGFIYHGIEGYRTTIQSIRQEITCQSMKEFYTTLPLKCTPSLMNTATLVLAVLSSNSIPFSMKMILKELVDCNTGMYNNYI